VLLQLGLDRLLGKLSGREVVPERAMRLVLIVLDSPRFNLLSGIVERHKDIRV
jgi:hypothetical protein